MKLLKALWNDEQGFVLSTELVMLGTLGVVGTTVGVNMAAKSINQEMQDFSHAIRSLDQSYCVEGHASKTAWTAGSCYRQEDVQLSLDKLGTIEAKEIELRVRSANPSPTNRTSDEQNGDPTPNEA